MAIVPPRRAEIDTRAPFRSVKEAVSLFGERVLAGEVYAGKLNKQMHKDKSIQHEQGSSKMGYMTAELEETKHSLLKAKQETTVMANCLSSLQEELERTRRELQELKLERESEKQMMEYETEDLKFIEDPPNPEIIPPRRSESKEVSDDLLEFQKKRYVTFANAHLSQVVETERRSGPLLERHPSLKKKKKQPLIPLIGGIFSKLWTGRLPKLSYLRILGCETYVKRIIITKLELKSLKLDICFFLGYPKEMKNYYFYNQFENKVIVARGGAFLE